MSATKNHGDCEAVRNLSSIMKTNINIKYQKKSRNSHFFLSVISFFHEESNGLRSASGVVFSHGGAGVQGQ